MQLPCRLRLRNYQFTLSFLPSVCTLRKCCFSCPLALALCHNVTPVYEDASDAELTAMDMTLLDGMRTYQASSPDEVMPAII